MIVLPTAPGTGFMKISAGVFALVIGASIALVPASPRAEAATAAPIAPPPERQIAQANAPGQALVQQVQDALVRLGYDPGPADGLIGERTTRSVRAFQQRSGLPVDGRVTQPLYRALLAAINKPAAVTVVPASPAPPATGTATSTGATGAVAANAVPNAAAAAGATFVDSVWTLTDPGGATLTLRLLADGKIAEVESPAFWRWQLRGDEIRINYDNKLGGWVERRGRIVSANELRGDANSSRDRKWTWRARRNVAAR